MKKLMSVVMLLFVAILCNAQMANPVKFTVQLKTNGTAEADDDRRIDECDLPLQPFAAAFLFHELRVAIVRRAAFNNVGDVDLCPVEIDHFEHIIEQFAGRADKRQTLQIFLFAGAFTDEHDACVLGTVTEYEMVPHLTEAAAAALRTRLLEFCPGFVHAFWLLFLG